MQDFYAELNVLDRKVELFVNSFVPRGAGVVKSLVTTVTLRVPKDTHSVPTTHWVFSGSAILNPKDQFDGVHGVQVAYKRAWQEMERLFIKGFSKEQWDQLRLARWKAMEGAPWCAQATPEALLPPETIAKLDPKWGALVAKYPHTADEMPPDYEDYYPTVGVLLEDHAERYGWQNIFGWRVCGADFQPKNDRDPFTIDIEAPKVIRWREVVDWEAERDPEAARQALLEAKYPHDATVEKPDHLSSTKRFDRNVGVLFADNSEGYAWLSENNWHVFAAGVVPERWEQIGPSALVEDAPIIRWRDITDWAREKEEHDRQSA
jgi:hypothetical protein